MKFILILSIFLVSFSNLEEGEEVKVAAIKKVLITQQTCWNNGDIDCFMESYWNSEDLKFIGSKGLNYGWQATLDNYKKSYPDKATMGKLTFDILSIEIMGKKNAVMVGKWHLERESPVGGHFTLIWKEIDGKWVITSDHTS